jgi:PBSX family phage portal protein
MTTSEAESQSVKPKSGDQATVEPAAPAATSNKQVIKALVIGDDLEPPPDRRPQERGTSKAKPQEDTWKRYKDDIVKPPIDPTFLATVEEYSTALQQCIEAMEVNIEGFGHRLVPLTARDQLKDSSPELKAMNEERRRVDNFLKNATGEDSLVMFRRKVRHDLEATGNAYVELARHPFTAKPDKLVQVPSYQCRLGKMDAEWTEYEVRRQLEVAPGKYVVEKVKDYKRFRRFLQINPGVGSGDAVWFKEYGDERVIDCTTGKVVPAEKAKDYPEDKRANEMIHLRIYSSRTPYGLPRYKGCVLTLLGDREAEEVNYTTLKNNNIPSMIVAVSNGQLTEETVDRMKQFVKEQIQGSKNFSKFLILEAEGIFEGTDPGNIRMDVKPLAQHQMKDQLFQEYGKTNRDKIRECFRLPPIFVGRSEDYTRATAESSRRLADEQIFRPERDEMDHLFNRILAEFDMVYHSFKSNGPNITDDEDLLKLLVAGEKAGGMTPRIADAIVSDILGRDVREKWPDGFDPDTPYSLTMANAVKNQADPTEPGQQVTAMKSTGGPEPADALAAIMTLRDQLLAEVAHRAS